MSSGGEQLRQLGYDTGQMSADVFEAPIGATLSSVIDLSLASYGRLGSRRWRPAGGGLEWVAPDMKE